MVRNSILTFIITLSVLILNTGCGDDSDQGDDSIPPPGSGAQSEECQMCPCKFFDVPVTGECWGTGRPDLDPTPTPFLFVDICGPDSSCVFCGFSNALDTEGAGATMPFLAVAIVLPPMDQFRSHCTYGKSANVREGICGAPPLQTIDLADNPGVIPACAKCLSQYIQALRNAPEREGIKVRPDPGFLFTCPIP